MLFEELLKKTSCGEMKKLAVAAAEDADVLTAVSLAAEHNIAFPVLIGDQTKIENIAEEHNITLSNCTIVHEPNTAFAAAKAVELARNGEVQAIMKGQLHSSVLMKAILNSEKGIKVKSVLSHVGIIESPKLDRLLFVTDGAMCTYPDLKQKVEIINNAVSLAVRLGVELPRVACVCAVENVNPAMPSTLDAAALAVMNQRGQITGCIVDGPLGFDNAVNADSAQHKTVQSPVDVKGKADIVLVPNIEAGNILLKASRNIADCKTAGLIIGASVPVIMSSRADTAENKLYAIACALYSSEKE